MNFKLTGRQNVWNVDYRYKLLILLLTISYGSDKCLVQFFCSRSLGMSPVPHCVGYDATANNSLVK